MDVHDALADVLQEPVQDGPAAAGLDVVQEPVQDGPVAAGLDAAAAAGIEAVVKDDSGYNAVYFSAGQEADQDDATAVGQDSSLSNNN